MNAASADSMKFCPAVRKTHFWECCRIMQARNCCRLMKVKVPLYSVFSIDYVVAPRERRGHFIEANIIVAYEAGQKQLPSFQNSRLYKLCHMLLLRSELNWLGWLVRFF